VEYGSISAQDLLAACLTPGDEQAWIEFLRRFHPLIARVALRVARQWGEGLPHVVDDLVQDTYLKLCADSCRALREFESSHNDAIYGYIKVFTANLAHDYFRVRNSQKRGGGGAVEAMDEKIADRMSSFRASGSDLERGLLITEIENCLQIISSGPTEKRDRRIFWLYYRVGLSASAISSIRSIALSTKGVESTIFRLTRLVRERLGEPEKTSNPTKPKGIEPAPSF
jgi:RNA polymerase sigma-70 factor, ECF subfamily